MAMNAITRLRIELSIDDKQDDDGYEHEFFFHEYSQRIRDLPNLQNCDILVKDALHNWTSFIEQMF